MIRKTTTRLVIGTLVALGVACPGCAQSRLAVGAASKGIGLAAADLTEGGLAAAGHIAITLPVAVSSSALRGGLIATFTTSYFLTEEGAIVTADLTRIVIGAGARATWHLGAGFTEAGWYLIKPRRKQGRRAQMGWLSNRR